MRTFWQAGFSLGKNCEAEKLKYHTGFVRTGIEAWFGDDINILLEIINPDLLAFSTEANENSGFNSRLNPNTYISVNHR